MAFLRKKMTPIERRLADLQKEMARVNQGLKTAARESPLPAGAALPTARAPIFRDNQPAAPAAAPAAGGQDPAGPAAAAGDLFQHAAQAPAVGDGSGDLFPGLATKNILPARAAPPTAAAPEPRPGRERFAHYFMAGHFQNLRPSRQESRVVRNKAILMLIAVAVLLAWLLYYWRSH